MAALNVHLDELISILLASSGLTLDDVTPDQIRNSLAQRLAGLNPELTNRLFHLDEWQLDHLAEFVVDAHGLAKSWEMCPTALLHNGVSDTRVD